MHFDCQSAAGFRINRMAEGQEPPRTVASFESSLEELEKVVKELESGDLPLDRSLELFSRGMELIGQRIAASPRPSTPRSTG